MSAFVAVAFNLLLNGAVSFVMALALTRVAASVLKLRPGPLRLSLWLSPFVKVLWDLWRGIPGDSFVWVHLLGAKQELGSFQVGLGLKQLSPPFLHATLAAHSSGMLYPQSVADILYRAIAIKVSPVAPIAVVGLLVAVASIRVAQRMRGVAAFRREARALLSRSTLESSAQGRYRRVRVYVSDEHGGAPFAAGIAHPFIIFPRQSLAALDEESRTAAIAHELSHVERHDPLLILALLLFADVFWFFPGLRWLLRRTLAEIEFCADRSAVQRGAHPVALADALVHTCELLRPVPSPALGLGGRASLLGERVKALLDPTPLPSLARRAATSFVVCLFVASILHSVFLGN